MKVAVIAEQMDVSKGGAERSILELTDALHRRGVEVRVLAARGSKELPQVTILGPQNTKRISLKHFIRLITQHVSKQSFDILHSTLPIAFVDIYQPRGGSYHEAAIRNAASFHPPWVRPVKRRTHLLNRYRTELIKAEKRICAMPNGPVIAALSGYVAGQFIEHYRLGSDRIHLIPNGIHKPPITHDPDAAKMLLRKFTSPKERTSVFFLFAAHNFRLKGLRSLLLAMAQLISRTEETSPHLIVAGRGNRRCYEPLIHHLQLNKKVHFLGPESNMASLIQACDVAVLPTYYDPCSRFILEALSLGKPVITTHFNGAAERYTHGRHGAIVTDPDNITELSDSLVRYCDPFIREHTTQAIQRDNLATEVDIKKHVDKLISLYENILQRKESRS